MQEVYDVIVVGSGPGGGSASLHCARRKLKTLVIEEHETIGEPVHCGECLSLYATKNTNIVLPNEVVSERVKGIRVVWPGNYTTILNEDGFVLEKEKFEQWLCQEAVKEGAELMLGTRLEKLERIVEKSGEIEEQLWLLKTNKANLKARIVIDATGVSSVVSRILNLNERFQSVIGIQYEMEGIERDGYLDFYLWPDLAPKGYLWMIPKSNNRANVGLVTEQKNKAKEFNDLFVKKMGWENKRIVKTFGGLIPSSGPLKKTYYDGVILVGDAAGFTSPLFEGGSHLALKSGEFAAIVAKEAIDKKDFSKEFLAKYEKLWKATFPTYEKIIRGKNALYGFSNEELEFIAKNLPRTFDNFKTLEKIVFGLKVLAQRPNFLLRGFIPAMQALGYSKAEFYGW
ncbi:MAG: NAD(P)/FAD-dependent oxidoreductase [Candidatus Diapherotrites archaeon]